MPLRTLHLPLAVLLLPLLAALAPTPVVAATISHTEPTYKESRITMDPIPPGPYSENNTIAITLRYHLSPRDAAAGDTRLVLVPLGPRNAPGATPLHRSYPGMVAQSIPVSPGIGTHTFRFCVTKIFPRNDLNFAAHFTTNGRRWPLNWSYDARSDEPLRDSIRLEPQHPFYTIDTDRPANLFTYDEPVRLRVTFRKNVTPGQRRLLHYRLHDARGDTLTGALTVTTAASGQHTTLTLPIPPERRGIFALETNIAEWGERELVFARIPDVRALTRDALTPFGGTEIQTEAQNIIARQLGLTHTRHHNFHWAKAQPAPGQWETATWDRILDTNHRHGIQASIIVVNPPLWIMPDGTHGAGFQPFPFDHEAWRESIRHLTTRWKNKLHSIEWLNEITPGVQTPDPVGDYLAFCRIGTETVREIAPRLQTQLAGGLWPRNFRQDVLRAGIARQIDILPVHYGDENSVLDARDDLLAAGETIAPQGRVILWDNESAHPVWVPLDMPWSEAIRDRSQSEWVLRRWPGELVAGAQRILYFGGFRSLAAGGWNYLIDADKPRPVAVTLAVQSAKLGTARPLGRIPLGELGIAYLFENAGKPIAILSTQNTNGETITLDLGPANASVTPPPPTALITDYQGNETRLPLTPSGQLTLKLDTLPVFVEAGSLDAWRSHAGLRVGDGRGQARFVRPRGANLHAPVEITNSFEYPLSVTLALRVPYGWPQPAPIPVTIPVGETRRLTLPLVIPPTAPTGRISLEATATFSTTKITAHQQVTLDVIDPSMLGNLLQNPGFENPGNRSERAAHWSTDPQTRRETAPPSSLIPGLGNHLLSISGVSKKWGHASQQLPVLPGQSYLYSLWVRTEDIAAGSNVSLCLKDGSTRTLHINRIFRAPRTSPWCFKHVRLDMPPDVETITVTPVANGPGNASFDNISVTLHEGTPWAALASRAARSPQVDGHFDDWPLARLHPLPLLADNQLTITDTAWRWSPENLSAAAWLQWDTSGLYLALRVRDDQHHTIADDARLTEGDSLQLALHPLNRAFGEDHRAFAYTVSDARPGTGGGMHTLYRDKKYAGGLTSGHLARDSSVYKLAIRRDDSARVTDYELFMPWTELGGIVPEPGVKFGLSLQLNDNDGDKRAAVMTWGDGLYPRWEPLRFGILTLVNDTE
ncbi:sugar-binding protein [Geminisphaera colitermitum]|uniref:sugar-binding protein n=1 Tax=Geminisphaera colitermitum TaxID=1148786 RepID=UPI000196506C|nr:sugar-binding protein [Geminisphaera colitermitum]